MKIRADQALMAGVVGLGAFAAYRMLKSKPAFAAPEGKAALGDPLNMQSGTYYRGRLEVPDSRVQPLLPFNTSGTEEDLGRGLVALGFQDVRVYMSPGEVPSDWPESTVAEAGSGSRWFEGQWAGPSMPLPRPGQLKLIWVR